MSINADLFTRHARAADDLPAVAWDDESRADLRRVRESVTLTMPYLDRLANGNPILVTAASALPLRRAAAVYGRAIKREARFDFPLATVDIGDQHVWLLPSRRFLALHTLIAGAVGFSADDGDRYGLSWLYVHPFERGTGLVDRVWPVFRGVYGPRFPIYGPFTEAGRRACQRLADGQHPPFIEGAP